MLFKTELTGVVLNGTPDREQNNGAVEIRGNDCLTKQRRGEDLSKKFLLIRMW